MQDVQNFKKLKNKLKRKKKEIFLDGGLKIIC